MLKIGGKSIPRGRRARIEIPGGIAHIQVELGGHVVKRQPLAVISDPMGEKESLLRSPGDGYIIGGITNPLVNRGDAVLHIAFDGRFSGRDES